MLQATIRTTKAVKSPTVLPWGMTGATSPAYREEAWLRQKYWDENLSQQQIADEAGVARSTIKDWMGRHGIERRTPTEALQRRFLSDPVPHKYHRGYEVWKHSRHGVERIVGVHRLAAIAWGELGSWDDEREVHHENGIPWDNREENVTALSGAEHMKEHEPWRDRNDVENND